MPDVEIKIDGLKELQAQLEALPPKTAQKTLRQGLVKAGLVIRDAMVRLAPRDTGFLAEHFNMKSRVSRKDISGSIMIGPNSKAVYPKSGGAKGGRISAVSVAGFLEWGTVKQSKQPFMTQAADQNFEKAVDTLIDSINESLSEV